MAASSDTYSITGLNVTTGAGVTLSITGIGVALGTPGVALLGRRGARVQGRLFGNEQFLRNRNVLNQLHTVRNRSAHDQLFNPLRKTFLMDLFDTFHKLHLDLRDGHVYNVFNGALLRTLKTPRIRSDLSHDL